PNIRPIIKISQEIEMRSGKCPSHLCMREQAKGQPIRIPSKIHLPHSLDSIVHLACEDAPNPFRIPHSLIRCSVVCTMSANKPRVDKNNIDPLKIKKKTCC